MVPAGIRLKDTSLPRSEIKQMMSLGGEPLSEWFEHSSN